MDRETAEAPRHPTRATAGGASRADARIKVGIADDNREFCDTVASYLRKMSTLEVAFVAHDGVEALESIEQIEPDVLLLDMIMPHLDGFGVMERLRATPQIRPPRIIVTSAVAQDSIIGKAMRMGATYYLVKPVNLSMLVKRIRQVEEEMQDPYVRRAETRDADGLFMVKDATSGDALEIDVTNLIHRVGVPAHVRGYQYLRDAIMLTVNDPEMIHAITKGLYPAVALKNGTTPSRVERAIRHAIEMAWERGFEETLKPWFGFGAEREKEKPSNGEFIAVLADKLRMERRQG